MPRVGAAPEAAEVGAAGTTLATMVRKPAAGVALALLLSACSNGEDYASTRALADALAEAGLACDEYREEQPVGPGSYQFAECVTSEGSRLALEVHEDQDAARRTVDNADIVLAGTTTTALVHATRWIVFVDDEASAKAVQQALGGDVTTVNLNER